MSDMSNESVRGIIKPTTSVEVSIVEVELTCCGNRECSRIVIEDRKSLEFDFGV